MNHRVYPSPAARRTLRYAPIEHPVFRRHMEGADRFVTHLSKKYPRIT